MITIIPEVNGERKVASNELFFTLYDFPELLKKHNIMITFWKVPLLTRLKLILTGTIKVSIEGRVMPPTRIDI